MPVTNVGLKLAVFATFIAVCVGIFVFLYDAAGGDVRLGEPYSVTVEVPNAFQLVPNADVRAAGVKIGTVTRISSEDGRVADVAIEIDEEHAPIHEDARALVRTKTLVGENYLDLEPGSARADAVPDGGVLEVDRSDEAVQLDAILSALDAPTRARVRRNLRHLGGALEGRGDELDRLFGSARPAVATTGRAFGLLERQKAAVARLVANAGRVMGAIGERRADLRDLATGARRTAEAVARRDESLRALVEELPGTLRQARTSAQRLGAFAADATPVVTDLRKASTDLRPVVADLRPAASGTRKLLDELPALLDRADPMLERLSEVGRAGAPAVGRLDEVLREAAPAVRHLRDYDRELGAFFANVGSALDTYDAVGNVARVHMLFGESSFGGLGPSARKALDALLEAGAMTEVHQVRTNAYPRPGTVESPRPFAGDYPRLEALPSTGP